MIATYQLTIDELKPGFVDQLKQMHHNGRVTVTVKVEEDVDETEFLLHNPKNRQRLLEAVRNVNEGKLTEVNLDDYFTGADLKAP